MYAFFVIIEILIFCITQAKKSFIHEYGYWAVSNTQKKKEVQLIVIHFYGARTYCKLN